MAEPPAKRARRTDSSTMWDLSESNSRVEDRAPNEVDGTLRREGTPREDTRRNDSRDNWRDDRRRRSRSRERIDRRRGRSKSRDRRGRDVKESRRDSDWDGRGVRDRERSASRDKRYSRRDYPPKTGRYRDRSPTRSRSPARNSTKLRTRSPPRGPKSDRREAEKDPRSRDDNRGTNGASKSKAHPKHDTVEDMDLGDSEEEADLEQQMRKMMGFTSFRSTQNTKVPGNNIYGVRKEKKTEYRQYMNRVGGFNRPLSPTR
ncbi:hypothetical protein VTO42DRAFT_197 [Malbranchea cinnamomea]